MGSPDLSVPSSIQDLISSSCENVPAQRDAHIFRSAEHPSRPTLEATNEDNKESRAALYSQDILAAGPSSYDIDNEANKKARDLGWWLILDMFTRQKYWSQLAKLEASSVRTDLHEPRRESEWLKRCLDIGISLSLLIVLTPVLLVVAILIRLESGGPALFRHSRVGEAGAEFELWKFRSMRVDTLKYEPSPASSTDPRLTLIGRAIRRISLDEIPQLVNVLRGEMSLVGPRPEMAFIVNHYTPMERKRLFVKPGITGLWQISSGRAAPIHHNLQYDLYYIKNKNILLDIAILLRTITAVIGGVGAV